MEEFKLMLAPMEGYTGPKFREICYSKGADYTFTEMARVSALARGNKSTIQKIRLTGDVPTYIQLIGSAERDFLVFLKGFTPKKGFLGFNLNLGCSSPDMVRIGLGSAMIKRISKVKRLVSILKTGGYPVTIKMRLGLNHYEKQKMVYLNLIKEVDADLFVVHARHGKETLDDPADFSVYKACVETGKNIVANGDISTAEQIGFLKTIGIHGAMIGRAALKDPEIFARLTKERKNL